MNALNKKRVAELDMTQRQLSRWFILIMEATGYILCALVGMGILYSTLAQVDVTVPCKGTVSIRAVPVVATEPIVVASWLLAPGQTCASGDSVCNYTRDHAAGERVRARHLLATAQEGLAALSDGPAQLAAEQVRAALESLTPPGDLLTMTAPDAGLFFPADAAERAETMAPGEPLGWVIDPGCLVMKGTAPPAQAGRIAVGNRARVTINDVVLMGSVVEMSAEADNAVVLRIAEVPESLFQQMLEQWHRRDVVGNEPEQGQALIITGRTSLFTSLFGRRG